jgi:hypothetical protein
MPSNLKESKRDREDSEEIETLVYLPALTRNEIIHLVETRRN